jgi:teichuronic acid biosynthesis glycosyltransferase TuaH
MLSFLCLVANTPWVYALAEALAANHPTHATRFYDLANYRRLRPQWEPNPPIHLQRSLNVLPPGYVGHLELLFRPYLQSLVKTWVNQLQSTTGTMPWIIAPYPYLAPWLYHLAAERLIYYNLDEYVYYQPQRRTRILAQEAELVDRAALTLCVAQSQVMTLQHRYPHRASRIKHFPLGVMDAFINPEPQRSPTAKTVGYIGNLSDRVDWPLVLNVAQACPDVTFIFVGGCETDLRSNPQSTWQTMRSAALALPNVQHLKTVLQSEVCHHYWRFAVNWIPYDIHHPFNQASCPTKVMDGIASGRPVISTDIPECRLYPDWIQIFNTVAAATELIRYHLAVVDSPIAQRHRIQQCKVAAQHTWSERATSLCQWVA